MAFWAVGQTVTGRESFAADRLEDAGFTVFLPRTRSRERKKIIAVFPGYLFVMVENRWRAIESTIGIIGLIMAGDHPARCPDLEIERLKSAQMRNGLIKLPKPPSAKHKLTLLHGDFVRILSGPFRGYNALYDGQTAKERERVLLDLLGRRVPLELTDDVQIAAL
jgi:transcription antitermination factor NusG